MASVLVRVPIAMKRHQDHGNSYKGKYLVGVAYSFRGLVRYCLGRKHGRHKAGRELVVLHLDLQTAEETVCHTECSLSKRDLKAHFHSDTFPPTRSHLLIVPLPMGPFSFKLPHPAHALLHTHTHTQSQRQRGVSRADCRQQLTLFSFAPGGFNDSIVEKPQ